MSRTAAITPMTMPAMAPSDRRPSAEKTVSYGGMLHVKILLLMSWILNWYIVVPFSLLMEMLWTVSESFTFSLLTWRRATYWLGSLDTLTLWFWTGITSLYQLYYSCFTYITDPAPWGVPLVCLIETQRIFEVMKVPGEVPWLWVGVEGNHQQTFLPRLELLLCQSLYHVSVRHWRSWPTHVRLM